MTLATFLTIWHMFVLNHTCLTFYRDAKGNGNHVVYGGGCQQAFSYAKSLHSLVAWAGASQGSYRF